MYIPSRKNKLHAWNTSIAGPHTCINTKLSQTCIMILPITAQKKHSSSMIIILEAPC